MTTGAEHQVSCKSASKLIQSLFFHVSSHESSVTYMHKDNQGLEPWAETQNEYKSVRKNSAKMVCLLLEKMPFFKNSCSFHWEALCLYVSQSALRLRCKRVMNFLSTQISACLFVLEDL